MFESLKIAQMANAMARHAATRQTLIAGNVANADTPGYRARDMASFAEAMSGDSLALRATRAGHVGGSGLRAAMTPSDRPGEPSPNGNTVSLEMEMVEAANVRQQHDMALSIYSNTSDILRAAMGRGR